MKVSPLLLLPLIQQGYCASFVGKSITTTKPWKNTNTQLQAQPYDGLPIPSLPTELSQAAPTFLPEGASLDVKQWLDSLSEGTSLDLKQWFDTLSSFDILPPDTPVTVSIPFYTLLFYGVFTALLNAGKGPAPSSPYPNKVYDAKSARRYYDIRPLEVIGRALGVVSLSTSFGLGLLSDYLKKEMDTNAEKRGLELATLLTTLGPSFIKIGQSLSIRTDILSPPYVRGLQSLQDQVPPFDTKVAFQTLEEDLGGPVSSLFKEITPEPIAAASLGQVYKATLLNGTEVAIKIQRPDIMKQIALDMYLIRTVAPILKRTFNLNTDLVGVVDTWGVGFVNELDYKAEADNAIIFMESMETTPLKNVVTAPLPLLEYCTDRVLTTEWVDGERLDVSTKEDVTILCSIAMNTYLTMMLETGILHADPHPGNLLRTPDGKLCILDWGMVTTLDPDLQVTLIEHMAHLTSRDYEEIPRDLLLLGFIPQEKAEFIKDSGVVETLAEIYGAWTDGGGAAAIDVNKVVSQLQDLTTSRGNIFQIPPYFAYIAKSFSVLEGIGLSNDAKYSIVNECLPYVSQRLLTDKSERTGGALSTFIFGPDKNSSTRVIDYKRVEQLITGFGSYSTSASGTLLPTTKTTSESLSKVQSLESAADQILNLILAEEETPLQNIFIEQLAKMVTSSSKQIFADLRERSGKLPSGRTVLGTLVDPLGLFRTSPLVSMTKVDQETVQATRKLIELLQEQSATVPNLLGISELSNAEILELNRILVQKVWSKRRGIAKTGRRLARMLVQVTAESLERGDRAVIPPVPKSIEPSSDRSSGSGVRSTSDDRSSSKRLENAKKLLEELEQTKIKEETVMNEEAIVEVVPEEVVHAEGKVEVVPVSMKEEKTSEKKEEPVMEVVAKD